MCNVYIYHAAPPAIINFFADFSNFELADFLLEAFDPFAFAGFLAFCPATVIYSYMK